MSATSNNIRLSVAIVTADRPEWLRRCLASWRGQDAQPYEIIVSDDSHDKTREELRAIAKSFDARWIPGPRRGLYANRNNAFYSCSGSHVMSADDDHTHPAGFVRTILSAIETDPANVWVVSERSSANSAGELLPPAELRSDGTVGPSEDDNSSAAISCGSTVYPQKVFDQRLRCDETYPFGAMWYLWGHTLREAGFRIRFCPRTFVWHHIESADDRRSDQARMAQTLECNLYVQAVHALRVSHRPKAVIRLMAKSVKLLTRGERIHGYKPYVRLSPNRVVRALGRACVQRRRASANG